MSDPKQENGNIKLVPVVDIIEAVNEAVLMLRYAAQQGINLRKENENDIDIVEAVIDAKNHRDALANRSHIKRSDQNGQEGQHEPGHADQPDKNGQESCLDKMETTFWKAYQQLAKRIQPVTINSIIAIDDDRKVQRTWLKVWSRGNSITRARASVYRYRNWSVFVLLTLLLVQFYTSFGLTIVNGIDENERAEIEFNQTIKALEEAKGKADKGSDDLKQLTHELAGIEAKKEQMEIQKEARYELLMVWDVLKFFHSNGNDVQMSLVASAQAASVENSDHKSDHDASKEEQGATQEDKAGKTGKDSSAIDTTDDSKNSLQSLLQRGQKKVTDLVSNLKPTTQVDTDKQTENYARVAFSNRYRAIQSGRIVLDAITTYFLPLLYGFLGACAYVLRSLTIQIRTYTYRSQSDIRFQLRLYLGALSGFAIAWFVNSETAPSIAESITPLALAFLAGYSVELVFSAMDALISTSGDRSQTQS